MVDDVLRIVLCSDGTGNTVVKNRGTNVYKLFEAVKIQSRSDEDSEGSVRGGRLGGQIAFYDDGVRTGNRLARIIGGAFGYGSADAVARLGL